MRAIYVWKNLVNGLVYIGSSCKAKARGNQHRHLLRHGRHPNKHFQAAWDLYGEQSFEFLIVEVVPEDVDLLVREQYWLDLYPKTQVYNMLPKASSPKGRSVSEAQRRAHSLKMRGRKQTPEAIEARMQKLRGRKQSPEEIQKRIESRKKGKGWTHTEATKEKLRSARAVQSPPMQGKNHTEEAKQRISESKRPVRLQNE